MGKYSFGSTGPKFNDFNLVPAFASVTTTATPATGSCGVQFVFKDVSGNALTAPVAGTFYISEISTGVTVDAVTSVAALTNGVVHIVDTGVPKYYNFVTSAAGLLGLTITGAADDYYVVFIKPDGSLLISEVCTSST